MQKKIPIAFLSYAPLDSDFDEQRMADLCHRLSNEIHVQTARKFEIFQHRSSSKWVENWKKRVEKEPDSSVFLIPVITPGYFVSSSCRSELETFLKIEKKLKRNDLVLPIYYISCESLDIEQKRERDALAKEIASRRYLDWRELRYEPLTSIKSRLAVSQLALQIRDAMSRETSPSKRRPGPAKGKKRATKRGAARPKSRSASAGIAPASQATEFRSESSQPTRRLSAKTDLQTLIVDQSGGQYTTISKAIEAAVPGARILIRPGQYREGLVITKPLEIIGEGDRDKIVISARGQDALLFKTNLGRVFNITLNQVGSGDWFGVDIAQGRLELEACDITSHSMACIAIRGGADPRLRRNRIHDGKEAGLFIYEDGLGIIEDNDIFNNVGGLAIAGGSNPTLRRNRIHHSKEEGVFIYEDAQGLLEDNEIFRNGYSGVEICEGGNPTLRRNRIYGNKESGIYVHNNGLGTIENNDIFSNRICEVTIKTGGNPTLRGNRIYGSKGSGIFIGDSGLGTIEDNNIIGNATAGVEITKGGNPTLRRNGIHENGYVAVWAYNAAAGNVEDNDLTGNAKGVWKISADSTALNRARNEES